MKLLLVGEETRRQELLSCLSGEHEITMADIAYEVEFDTLSGYDAIFDLNADEDTSLIDEYPYDGSVVLIASAVKSQLAGMIDFLNYEGGIFGMNCLPTFINKPLKEVSVLRDQDISALRDFMGKMGWEYQLVSDRVGMVTPRVICMIINEACYTVQEGTATIPDIDKSMKLGTAYPMGPFEWADKIGVKDVFETLEAMYGDTGDDRYRICPLLKTHYLKDLPFLK